MQVVLVYLQPFRRNSVLKCALHPKIAKNSLKTPFQEVQSRSRSTMLINLKSLSPVGLLVMISSMYVPICNRFHATRVNSGKNTFRGGVAVFDAVCAGLLELRGSGLGLLKSTFGAENFLRRLSWSISSHFVAI